MRFRSLSLQVTLSSIAAILALVVVWYFYPDFLLAIGVWTTGVTISLGVLNLLLPAGEKSSSDRMRVSLILAPWFVAALFTSLASYNTRDLQSSLREARMNSRNYYELLHKDIQLPFKGGQSSTIHKFLLGSGGTRYVRILGINSISVLHGQRKNLERAITNDKAQVKILLLHPNSQAFKDRENMEEEVSSNPRIAERIRSEQNASIAILRDIAYQSIEKIGSEGDVEERLQIKFHRARPEGSILAVARMEKEQSIAQDGTISGLARVVSALYLKKYLLLNRYSVNPKLPGKSALSLLIDDNWVEYIDNLDYFDCLWCSKGSVRMDFKTLMNPSSSVPDLPRNEFGFDQQCLEKIRRNEGSLYEKALGGSELKRGYDHSPERQPTQEDPVVECGRFNIEMPGTKEGADAVDLRNEKDGKFNRWYQPTIHNAFEKGGDKLFEKSGDKLVEKGRDKLSDEISLYEILMRGFSSIELDVHAIGALAPNSRVGGAWFVTHKLNIYAYWRGWIGYANCDLEDGRKDGDPLAHCLEALWKFHEFRPHHDPLTVFLDINKETNKESVWDDMHEPADFDELLTKHIRKLDIFKPGDLKGIHGDLRTAAQADAWPNVSELQGKFIFVLTGQDIDLNEYIKALGYEAVSFIAPNVSENTEQIDDPTGDQRVRGHVVFYNMTYDQCSKPNTDFLDLIFSNNRISRCYSVCNGKDSYAENGVDDRGMDREATCSSHRPNPYQVAIDHRINFIATDSLSDYVGSGFY